LEPQPEIGEVYWVDTWILSGKDPRPARPVVVVRAPSSDLERVFVITSTKDVSESGVHHPADPSLELPVESVFALKNLRSAEARYFKPPQVRLVGKMGDPYLSEVLGLYEKG
jgi:hypothetical protein